MPSFQLNKLVRDKIVEQHEAIGGSVMHSVLEGPAIVEAGLDKLQEELDEARASFKATEKVGLGELADIRQLTEDINAVEGRSLTELHAYQYDKKRRVGGFVKWLFVKAVSVPEDSDLAQYYASDPKRFPEVKNE